MDINDRLPYSDAINYEKKDKGFAHPRVNMTKSLIAHQEKKKKKKKLTF